MPKYNTIDEYIDAQSQPQAERLQELRNAILKAVPDAIETFNYGVPAFSFVQNGKRDQQIMIGAFKNHVGIYPHPTTIVEFEKELSEFNQGKGSIQFPLDQSIPMKLIVKMVKYRKKLIQSESKK
ncbi:iron chaperone [Endothiovibrio diazotrophicus]